MESLRKSMYFSIIKGTSIKGRIKVIVNLGTIK